jgi:hypothetical protein
LIGVEQTQRTCFEKNGGLNTWKPFLFLSSSPPTEKEINMVDLKIDHHQSVFFFMNGLESGKWNKSSKLILLLQTEIGGNGLFGQI